MEYVEYPSSQLLLDRYVYAIERSSSGIYNEEMVTGGIYWTILKDKFVPIKMTIAAVVNIIR